MKNDFNDPFERKGLEDALNTIIQQNSEIIQILKKIQSRDGIPNTCRDKSLQIPEAAEFTGLSKSYLYHLVEEKKIPFYKPAGRLYFKQEELEDFIYRNRTASDYEINERANAIMARNRK